MLNWPITTEQRNGASRTHWTSPCGQWRVTRSVPEHADLAERWYALTRRTVNGWTFWDRLRKPCRAEGSAWRAVERAIRAAEMAARREAKRAERRRVKAARAAKRRRRAARPRRQTNLQLFA